MLGFSGTRSRRSRPVGRKSGAGPWPLERPGENQADGPGRFAGRGQVHHLPAAGSRPPGRVRRSRGGILPGAAGSMVEGISQKAFPAYHLPGNCGRLPAEEAVLHYHRCCTYLGKGDRCPELTAFRRFRDGYLANQPQGPERSGSTMPWPPASSWPLIWQTGPRRYTPPSGQSTCPPAMPP